MTIFVSGGGFSLLNVFKVKYYEAYYRVSGYVICTNRL